MKAIPSCLVLVKGEPPKFCFPSRVRLNGWVEITEERKHFYIFHVPKMTQFPSLGTEVPPNLQCSCNRTATIIYILNTEISTLLNINNVC